MDCAKFRVSIFPQLLVCFLFMKFSLCLLTENVLRRETRDSNGALSTTQPNCGLDFSEISEKNRGTTCPFICPSHHDLPRKFYLQ